MAEQRNTKNFLIEAEFYKNKTMLNRVYLNSFKMSLLSSQLNKMYPDNSIMIKSVGEENSLIESSLETNSWALTASLDGISANSGAEFEVQHGNSKLWETSSVSNKDKSIGMESIYNTFSHIDSVKSISCPTKLQNVVFSRESSLLEKLRNNSKWSNLLNYPWIFHIIRDMLTYYGHITSCYPISSKEHGRTLEFIPIFNMFKLLYAMILYLECDFNNVEMVNNCDTPEALSLKEVFYKG